MERIRMTKMVKLENIHFTVKQIETELKYRPDITIENITSEEKNIDFIFREPGTYSIQLVVKDDNGKDSENIAVKTIKVFPVEKRIEKTNVDEMKRLYKHLIKREILSKPHHYIIDHSKVIINIDEKRDIEQFKNFHDVSMSTIRKIGDNSHRNNLIINKLVSLVKKEKRESILLFACSIRHSKLISFVLDAVYGIKSASIDHTMSIEDRDQVIHDFRISKISVLCNYGILSTGFDSPKVECVFVARPTFSHLLYNQMTGRGLRGPRSNGTSDCIIVDISDNIQLETQGIVVEQPWVIFKYIYETTFDEREQEKKEQKCYGCFGLKQRKIGKKLQNCEICNGVGIISPKKQQLLSDSIPKKNKEELRKLQMEIFAKHPNWDPKTIGQEVKKRIKYDKILQTKTIEPTSSNEWRTICKKCNKISYDMPSVLSQFGRLDDLVTNSNPKGIFPECKDCRNE